MTTNWCSSPGHLEHGDSGPHVWFTLGSRPWFEGDDRNCWVTMHIYVDDDNVVTRIEDLKSRRFGLHAIKSIDICHGKKFWLARVLKTQSVDVWIS